MRRASPSPFILSPVAIAVSRLAVFCATLGMTVAGTAHAQAVPAAPATAESGSGLKLKPTPKLAEEVANDPDNRGPSFIFGDRVSGRPDLETVIDGNAELRRGATSIRADHIEYYQPDDQL